MAPQGGGPTSGSADRPFGPGAGQALAASPQHQQQGAYGQQHGQTQPLTSGTIQQMCQRGYAELRPEDVAQLQAAFGDNWPALAGAYLGLNGSSQVPLVTEQQRSPASGYQQGPMPPLPPAVDGGPRGGVMPPLPPPEESAPEGYDQAGGHQHMAGMHLQGHPGVDVLAATGARPEAEHDAAAAAAAEVAGGVYGMPEQVAAAHLVAQMQQGGSPGDQAGSHTRTLSDAPLDTKRCTSCKDFKPRDQFNKDKTRGDGLACTCRPCANRNTKNWHHKHRQQNKAKSELRKALPDSAHCTHCKVVKASTEFYGDRSQSNGLKPHCKVCEREIKRDRRQRKAAVEALSLGQAGMVVKRQKLRHTSEGEAELEGQQAVEAQAQALGEEWAAGQQMDPQLLQQMIQQQAQGQPQLQDPNMHLPAACGHQLQTAQ